MKILLGQRCAFPDLNTVAKTSSLRHLSWLTKKMMVIVVFIARHKSWCLVERSFTRSTRNAMAVRCCSSSAAAVIKSTVCEQWSNHFFLGQQTTRTPISRMKKTDIISRQSHSAPPFIATKYPPSVWQGAPNISLMNV